MPRKQRDQQSQQPHYPPNRPATEAANPFADSSFLVTPTIGHSGLSPRASHATNGPNAPQPTLPTQVAHAQSDAIADETPPDSAAAWATRMLPPLDDPTAPTAHDALTAPTTHLGSGVSRAARPTGAPQRDAHAAAQRALVRALTEDERQLAGQRIGDATPAVIIQGAKKAPRSFRALGPVAPRRRGPTSFLAQFIVTMVTTVILFSVVTLATPLGQSAVMGNPFQAYANAVPIIPTATPTSPPTATPLPVGYNPGAQVIMNMIRSVFGPYAQGALNVSRCESGYDPNAWNPYPIGNSHASGVFQILYPSTWDTTSYSGFSPYDANANIHAAYQIFSRDGYSWREWQCQP